MLIELKCDSYSKNCKTVYFKNGLNIVLGQDNKANSIGKSTFLLAVDFAFGGNSYVDSKNKIVKLFGGHTICFAHKFAEKTLHFSRSTRNPDVVEICDENYTSKNDAIKISDFTSFLKKQYKLEKCELSFRDIVSVYSHIAGRFETDFDNLLKNSGDTSQSKSILRFEKLFDEYSKVKPKAESHELAEKKTKTFKNAENFGFIRKSISSPKDAEKLKSELEKLKTEIETAKTGKIQNLFKFEGKTAQETADIKKELKALRSTRTRLQSEIVSIQKLDKSAKPSEKDMQVLQSYFPSVNLKKIEDIANFHSSIFKILNEECDDETERLQEKLSDVSEKIEELENQISPALKDIPQTVLEEYGKKAIKIEELEKTLKFYELKANLIANQSATENELRITQEQVLSSVENKVNLAMKNFDEKSGSPLRFEFPTQKSYHLFRENDVGTGTKHLNLIIFDLAVLSMTRVPYLIHDSYIFHELEDERLNFALSLYASFCKNYNKQAFIAIDGQDKCNNASKAIIQNARVVQLGEKEETLFGVSKR